MAVVGSINVDHIVKGGPLPGRGETVVGGTFARHPGGKGANQAVAAARWGAAVSFVGAVGDDADGKSALDALRQEGIEIDGVVTVDAATGVALIVVDGEGDNQIAVASGANDFVVVPDGWDPGSGVVLTGFEVPDSAVVAAARTGVVSGCTVVIDPAPARPLPNGLPRGVLLTPNGDELAAICEAEADGDVVEQARALARRIEGTVVVTLGSSGALVCTGEGEDDKVPAPGGVDVVDTTGAGDALAGVLAAMLAEGAQVEEAVRQAVAAASQSTTVAGARAGMPRRQHH